MPKMPKWSWKICSVPGGGGSKKWQENGAKSNGRFKTMVRKSLNICKLNAFYDRFWWRDIMAFDVSRAMCKKSRSVKRFDFFSKKMRRKKRRCTDADGQMARSKSARQRGLRTVGQPENLCRMSQGTWGNDRFLMRFISRVLGFWCIRSYVSGHQWLRTHFETWASWKVFFRWISLTQKLKVYPPTGKTELWGWIVI